MSLDLDALAQSGATTLIAAMATELWQQTRRRAAGVLSLRDSGAERALADELEASRARLQASPAEESQVESGLRGLLSYQLRRDPEAAAAFADLLGELAREGLSPAARSVAINQQATVGANGFSVQAGNNANVSGRPRRWWSR